MRRNSIHLTFLITLLFAFTYSSFSHAAGFNCKSKKLSAIENLICSDSNLSALDEKLNRNFKDVLSEATDQEKEQFLEEQHQWVTDVRDKCNQNQLFCLTEAYRSRNAELETNFEEARTENMLNNELPELARRSSRSIEEIKEVLSNDDESQQSQNIRSYLYSIHTDIAMDSVLAKKLELLPPVCREKLQASQAKWKKDMLSYCSKEADEVAEGGSMAPLLGNICVNGSTKTRIAQLKLVKSCNNLPN